MSENKQEQMNIVFAGHVDHGKSTVVGRLLADTHSLPEGKLEAIKQNCHRNSKPFEYAFLIDALKDEQSQGITIDAARVFFKTEKRNYVIIDAPGHIEFLKNMVTGASRAEAAILVIDAEEGVKENSKRHGYMISMLRIRQLLVVVNKMDLVAYKQEIFDKITTEYSSFLKEIKLTPEGFIPLSGMKGDSVANLGHNMPWYQGPSLLQALDQFSLEADRSNKAFRMPVQDIYKFTKFGDSRRVIVGTIESGRVKLGDKILFYPSGKKTRVKTIESFNSQRKTEVSAGHACGLTMEDQIYITRGEMAVLENEKQPAVSSSIKVNLFWLSRTPMTKGREYHLKSGTAKIACRIDKIIRVIDASTLNPLNDKDQIDRHDVAECVLKLKKPLAFDLAEEIAQTSRFVIVDEYEIAGGGIIREEIKDAQSDIRNKVFLRNFKWEKSFISPHTRARRYNQKSTLILITGLKDIGKKEVAKKLEEDLFHEGKFVYFLGIGNLLYGLDADIKDKGAKEKNRPEHIRRLAEVAHILMDAGVILIVTAVELAQDDLEIIKTVVDPAFTEVIWLGEEVTTDISFDYQYAGLEEKDILVEKIKESLIEKGVIFHPW
ncbi:MAG: adenylyl-sulfate kinase [Spirochaetales bacterium]|nr:adenylyl-sulfate kinase [Spirochaetales bacterium]